MTMTQLPPAGETTAELARAALARAVALLLSRQYQDGRWQGEPEASVTEVAQGLLLREILGRPPTGAEQAGARWIRSAQRPDGGWAPFPCGQSELAATAQAYVALRLAGDPPDAYHLALAAGWIRDAGGLAGAGICAKTWFALLGLWPWDDLPAISPRIGYLAAWVPLPGWPAWLRGAVVPLAVIRARRPARNAPFDLIELRPPGGGLPAGAGSPEPRGRPGLADRIGQVLRGWQRSAADAAPVRAGQVLARRRCAERIVACQDRDGSWGAMALPTAFALIALGQLGYSPRDPVLARGLSWLDQAIVWEPGPTGQTARRPASERTARDTALTVTALAEAGLPSDHLALARAADWLARQEIHGPGDRQVRRPGLAPAGWAGRGDGRPDCGATSAVLLALRRVVVPMPVRATDGADREGRPSAGQPAASARALAWLAGSQSRAGGWASAGADRPGWLAGARSRGDAVLAAGRPSAAATADAVAALSSAGLAASKAVRGGVIWLLRAQGSDGAWHGHRGRGDTVVTSGALRALLAAGVLPAKQPVRRAVGWLIGAQNADGGWPEQSGRVGARSALILNHDEVGPGPDAGSPRSSRGTTGSGPDSTPTATANAVLALIAAGGAEVAGSAERGIRWLADGQRSDGDWDEPQAVISFRPAGCLRSHLSRLCCPVRALSAYLSGSV